MIRFIPGSGRFESSVELYHFDAIDDREGTLRGVISQIAIEDLTGDAFDENDPMALFKDHEREIFELAESVFVFRGLNERGVLAVASHDTLRRLAF